MINIFDREHIFVVFTPGTGGNFITGLLNAIVTNNTNGLNISSTGSSHTVLGDKIDGRDFISFGTLPEDRLKFVSEKDREDFYLDGIKKSYTHILGQIISWSHDYSNIQLYRKYFPNARILVLTHQSIEEKLTALIMNMQKTLLDSNAIIPTTQEYWDSTIENWYLNCKRELSILGFDDDFSDTAFKNRFDKRYNKLITFATLLMLLRYNGLMSTVESIQYKEFDIFDKVVCRTGAGAKGGPPYIVVGEQSSYIDDKCVKLPYGYLIENNSEILLNSLSTVLGFELSHEQELFVRNEFQKYRASQDKKILTDPKGFYLELKSTAMLEITP